MWQTSVFFLGGVLGFLIGWRIKRLELRILQRENVTARKLMWGFLDSISTQRVTPEFYDAWELFYGDKPPVSEEEEIIITHDSIYYV